MHFKKAKCKVLQLGQGNPKYKYWAGEEGIRSSPEEKDVLVHEKYLVLLNTKYLVFIGVLVHEKFNVTWQCALDIEI